MLASSFLLCMLCFFESKVCGECCTRSVAVTPINNDMRVQCACAVEVSFAKHERSNFHHVLADVLCYTLLVYTTLSQAHTCSTCTLLWLAFASPVVWNASLEMYMLLASSDAFPCMVQYYESELEWGMHLSVSIQLPLTPAKRGTVKLKLLGSLLGGLIAAALAYHLEYTFGAISYTVCGL